jgi:hypothetical protein
MDAAVRQIALLCVALALGLFQGCSGIEVKPPDEFGYRRTFNPPA